MIGYVLYTSISKLGMQKLGCIVNCKSEKYGIKTLSQYFDKVATLVPHIMSLEAITLHANGEHLLKLNSLHSHSPPVRNDTACCLLLK